MAVKESISRELLSASFNLLARKIRYENAARTDGTGSFLSQLLGRSPSDPAPNMSVKELAGIFEGALKERHPVLNTAYSSSPGELNERSTLSVSTAYGMANPIDKEEGPVIKVNFNHSDMFFGRKFTFDKDGVISYVSGQPLVNDRHLNDECKKVLGGAEKALLADMTGVVPETAKGQSVPLGDLTKGSSNAAIRSMVGKLDNILKERQSDINDYARSLNKDVKPVTETSLAEVVKDYKESRELLSANPFPERKDCVKIQHADARWAKAEEAVMMDDSVVSKDLLANSKQQAGSAFRDIGRVWEDSVFRGMVLTNWRDDLSYARKLDMLRQDFVVSAEDSGHSLKETLGELEKHLDGFTDKEKRRIMSDAKDQYRKSRRGKLDDLKEFINHNGTDALFDYSYGYKSETVSLDEKREKLKGLSGEYSALNERLGGKSLSSNPGLFTGFDSLSEYRETGDKPMLAGTFMGAVLEAGLVAAAFKKSKPLGIVAAGLFCYLAFNQDKLFGADHKINDFFREVGVNPSKIPGYKEIFEACSKKAMDNPEWEKSLLARFPDESKTVIDSLNKAIDEKISLNKSFEAMKTEKFVPDVGESKARTFDFVYINKDNAQSVLKSGKIESLSFEQTDYGVPNLLVGNNTYAIPGDGLFIVKDQNKVHSVLTKDLFEANFKKLSANKCVANNALAEALKPVKKAGKGIKKG